MSKYIFFWKPPRAQGLIPPVMGVNESCCSNWTISPFVLNEVEYNCNEQYMMAQKAVLFNDQEMLQKIMKTKSPKYHKIFGRKVKNFVPEVWEKNCEQIVFDGALAKFSQNPEMKQWLLSTGDAVLVEASPYDRIWGIGLAPDDKRCLDPSKWRGKNLLGKCLMKVRDSLVE